MAFRQVQDLLEWVVEFHNQLATQYRVLAGEQQDERMKMTLDFLADREQRMHQSMANYLQNANPNLLKTWLIDSQNFSHPQVLERIPPCLGCRDTQDILANVITAHQLLKDMYRLRAQLASIPEETELFDMLANNQDAEARLQTRDIGRLDSY